MNRRQLILAAREAGQAVVDTERAVVASEWRFLLSGDPRLRAAWRAMHARRERHADAAELGFRLALAALEAAGFLDESWDIDLEVTDRALAATRRATLAVAGPAGVN